MVEPALDPGAIRFAIIVSLMVLSAGVASFPPARDFRVFLGAAILGGAWVLAIAASMYFNNWAITSSLFVLDVIYIVGFYLISRPLKNDNVQAAKERNWAGYVVAVLTILVAVELAHALSNNDFFLRPLAIALLFIFSLVIFWGFARGFSLTAAFSYLVVLILVNLLAINFFILTANVLTLIAFFIIIWRAMRGAKHNIQTWSKAIISRRKSREQKLK